jgi:phosphatidylserine/phosphatidylglycerophosphate/cardiolipin synthase-like enzyme
MILLSGNSYPIKVIPLIEKAHSSIDIVVYDWRWYEGFPEHSVQKMNLALLSAVRRKVKVRAVLNNGGQADFLSSLGIKARTPSGMRTVHTKLLIIDNAKVVIGSHNFTSNAFYRNLECSILFDIVKEETLFKTYFNNLYSL